MKKQQKARTNCVAQMKFKDIYDIKKQNSSSFSTVNSQQRPRKCLNLIPILS
jgi:hypothetical protein